MATTPIPRRGRAPTDPSAYALAPDRSRAIPAPAPRPPATPA